MKKYMVCLVIFSFNAHANTITGQSSASQYKLPQITVSAARTAKRLDQIPATVTVQTADDMEERMVRDARDIARYEPNVSVGRSPSRFSSSAGTSTGREGNSGFNIRGLEGNRVLVLIDSIRIPNYFSFGGNAFGRGDWFDVGLMQRVEILRGAASNLYGSDGLAGVVSFITKDPKDLLRITGKNTYVGATIGYAQEDRSWNTSIATALRSGNWDLMVSYIQRDGHELGNKGTNNAHNITRTTPNPQTYTSRALLAKAVYHASSDNRIRITLDAQDRRTDTIAWSAVSVAPFTAPSITGLTAEDDLDRTRISIDQHAKNLGLAWSDSVRWYMYYQRSNARQTSLETRFAVPKRTRDTQYAENWWGLGAQSDKHFYTGNISHRITYGFEGSQALYSVLRNGTFPAPGETFPNKPFPDTKYTLVGLFLHDDIGFADERFILSPGVRFDAYGLTPSASPLYPGTTIKSLSGSQLSPKIGVLFKIKDDLNVYANLAQGFKAPLPNEVNTGFMNVIRNYFSIANPNLKPERSRTLEVGLRRTRQDYGWHLAAFTGQYKDFIAQRQISGNATIANPAIFQFINVGQVSLHGVEASGFWQVNSKWRLTTAFGLTRGTDDSRNAPLNSVEPYKLVLGSDWNVTVKHRLGIWITHVGSKSLSAIDSAGLVTRPNTQFSTPAYTTIDAVYAWKINRHATLNAGIFNITDQKYWRWSDVRGLPSNSPVVDAYTQPGRNIQVAFKIEF
jgi:hemoglobin/transferrin/lactoferrin receptor protein